MRVLKTATHRSNFRSKKRTFCAQESVERLIVPICTRLRFYSQTNHGRDLVFGNEGVSESDQSCKDNRP